MENNISHNTYDHGPKIIYMKRFNDVRMEDPMPYIDPRSASNKREIYPMIEPVRQRKRNMS